MRLKAAAALTPGERPTARAVSVRLDELERDISALITRLGPHAVAVESLFAHYKHPATAIVMGHARGVILLAIRRAGVELLEFRPTAVKKSMIGHGQATKGQIQAAVQAEFNLAEPPSPPDVADAVAIALCALRRGVASTGVPQTPRRSSRRSLPPGLDVVDSLPPRARDITHIDVTTIGLSRAGPVAGARARARPRGERCG